MENVVSRKKPLMLKVKGMIGLKKVIQNGFCLYFTSYFPIRIQKHLYIHTHSNFPFLDDNKKLDTQRTCA